MDLIVRRLAAASERETRESSLLRDASRAYNIASKKAKEDAPTSKSRQSASSSFSACGHASTSNSSMRPSNNSIQSSYVVRQAGDWRKRRDKAALAVAQSRCLPQQMKWNNRLEEILDERLEQKTVNEANKGPSQGPRPPRPKSAAILKKGRKNLTDFLTGAELLYAAMDTVGKAERMLEDFLDQTDQVNDSSRALDPRNDSQEESDEDGNQEESASASLLPSLALNQGPKKPAAWSAMQKMVGGQGAKVLGTEFIQSLNENVSLAEAAKRRQDALERGRSKSVDPILPSFASIMTSDRPLVYSGAYRLSSLRRTMNEEKISVVARNPAAFQMEAGLVEEAEYRNKAEVARLRTDEMTKDLWNEHRVESWRSSIRSLRNARPYFLPPVLSKEHTKRLNIEEQKDLAAKMGRDWEAEEAVLNEKRSSMLKSESEKWTVKESQFWERRIENEARSIFETDALRYQQFSIDWGRIVEKTRFRKFVGMEDRNVKAGGQLGSELAEVRAEVHKYSNELRFVFSYYSSAIDSKFTSDSTLMMTFQPWMSFCSQSGILNPHKRGCTAIDLENIFVAVNFEESGNNNTAESKANDDDSMMRFEFLEGIVRAAFGFYITTGLLTDASDATEKFVREIVLPNVPPEALYDPNEFRRLRLYTYDMDKSLTAHWDLLKAIFQLYKAKDKTKYLAIEHWAKLIFVWSQISVADELKRRKRAVGLVFFDFVEAVARVADFISPVSTAELHEMRGPASLTNRASIVGDGGKRRALNGHDLPPSIPEVPEGEANDMDAVPLAGSSGDGSRLGRSTSAGFSAPGKASRGLNVKFDYFCEYLGQTMAVLWGGKNLADCIERMNKTARMLSGGTELG